jgi:transcriptional regulator with XRE-family HTH domain
MFTTMNNLRWLEIYELIEMDQEAKKRFVEKLVQAQAGRSQRRFAVDLEVQLGTLQNWLRGDSFPTPDNFKKIAAAVGMSQVELFSYILGEEQAPALPNVAEQALNYSKPLSKSEKVRLIKLLVDEVAE